MITVNSNQVVAEFWLQILGRKSPLCRKHLTLPAEIKIRSVILFQNRLKIKHYFHFYIQFK